MALSSGSKIQISDINTALNGKLNTSGGTINGDISVTGRIVATGIVKGMRLCANNGTNNNIDFMHDSKAEGGYYLNFDKISNGSWLEIATVGSGSYPQVQKSTVSNKRVYAPSGGTWFCFGEWGYETDSDSYKKFASVNGVSGGGIIVAQTGNSYYSHWSEIYCIRTA